MTDNEITVPMAIVVKRDLDDPDTHVNWRWINDDEWRTCHSNALIDQGADLSGLPPTTTWPAPFGLSVEGARKVAAILAEHEATGGAP